MFAFILKMNELLNVFLRLVALNFLWLVTTFVGLIFFSIGPATYAVGAILKRMISGSEEFPLLKTYLAEFKSHYKESLLLSWFYLILGHILVIDLLFVDNLPLKILLIVLAFFYFLSLTFVLPVMLNFSVSGFFKKIRAAFLVGFGSLHYSLVLYAVLVLLDILILKTIPGLMLLLGISLNLYIIFWFSRQIFARIEISTTK